MTCAPGKNPRPAQVKATTSHVRRRDGEDLGDAHATGEQISGPEPVAPHSA